jgi:hypothetical protein
VTTTAAYESGPFDEEARIIAANIQSGNCVFFVGAGLSAEAGLPRWSELTANLIQELRAPTTERDPLTVAQAFEQLRTRKALTDRLRQLLDCSSRQPTEVHSLLATLGVDLWITTNFDDLLERALGCTDRTLVVDSDYARFQPAGGRPTVLKLHGDLAQADSLVVTKNDYMRASLGARAKWTHVEHLLAYRSFVFIGYSLRDVDFEQLQARIIQYLGIEHIRDSFAVTFDVDPLRAADLESRRVRVVDLSRWGISSRLSAVIAFIQAIKRMRQRVSQSGTVVHPGLEGLSRAPADTIRDVSTADWEFICCCESLLYAPDEDYPVQPRPGVSIPDEYRRQGYLWKFYRRVLGNTSWDGVAIWRSRAESEVSSH